MKLRIIDRIACLFTGKTLATLDHERELKEIEMKRAAARAEHERQMELERFRKEERDRKQQLELEQEAANTREVFLKTKGARTTVDPVALDAYKETLEQYIASFDATGQESAKAKATWLLSLVDKERELMEMGFNKFVYRSKLVKFVKEHKSRAIQVVSSVDYLRMIPEEARAAIERTKHIFDDHVIVYTDHSIKAKAHAVRREPDPILFGIFSAKIMPDGTTTPLKTSASHAEVFNSNTAGFPVMSDRMYFLADWEDDNCDLTFDQMLEEGAEIGLTEHNIGELEAPEDRVNNIISL